MKRIKNADINFKLNPKRINLKSFSMRFYTVNSKAYFFIKDQDNVVSVEREATIYDDPEVIISGGTVAVDYYLPLDWSELVQLGEGVLNYRCINNIDDPFFPDLVYNQVVEDTTAYYIDSDIHIDPAEDDKNLIERVVELESNLAVETADREDADVFLSGAVDTEIARAISAETELSERIDELESGASEALDAEIERAISAETALQDAIDAEEARAIAIENAIRQDLTDESELRSSADTAMWTAINDEIVRSTSAETALDNKIDVENLRAIGVENAISGNLETYKATNNAALQAETTRATSAETVLQSAINDETTARANADSALGTRIDNISSASTAAIEAEEARAREAESGLTNAINNEVTRATSAETIIANSLNAEINRASSAETALNNQIDAEVLRATAAEAELEAKIGVVSGVTELINAETLRATTAENALDEKIGNVSGSVISEEARAISAETALDAKIDTVSGNVLTEEARAKGVENALSGAIDTIDAKFIDDAKYEMSGQTHVINFYNGSTIKATIDCTDFLVDGMIDDVRIETISGVTYLVIDFNTASGKEDIQIPLTDIFNPANYYTKSETSGATEIATALAQKLAISDFNTYSGAVDTTINSKAAQSDLDALSGTVNGHISDSTIHLTSGNVQTQIDNSISGKANSSDVYLKTETSGATELATAFAAKQDQLIAGENIIISGNVISSEGGGVDVDPSLDSGSTNPVANSAITNNTLSGGVETSDFFRSVRLRRNNGQVAFYKRFAAINGNSVMVDGTTEAPNFQLVETSAITTSVTSASTDSQIPSAKAVYDALGSASGGITSGEVQTMITSATTPIYQTIEDNEEVTAAALNVLNGELANKLDVSAYTPVDLSNYYTKSETSGATEIATAFAATQPKLSAGTGISIDANNVISTTGGGGGSYTASSGITIDSNDVIGLDGHFKVVSNNSAQIPSTVGDFIHIGYLGTNIGYANAAKGQYSLAVGSGNIVGTGTYYGVSSMAVGNSNKTFNNFEFASGQFNVSSKASDTFGDSGNTLFSVGNGTADDARHNAFEIRQNGDIYISSGGTDIKLQDHLGGGGSSYSAGTGIDITNDVISVTGMTTESAFTVHTGDSTIHVTSSDKTSWNGAATNASNAVTALGGLSLVKLTQTQYDNLANKDNNTLYVIVG